MSEPYVFHGADLSYFSGKARPALQQKGLHFREVQPDMAAIVKNTGVAFIPVLVTPQGEWLQDTSHILDVLEERHPEPPLYPRSPLQRIVAYLIELYGDELGLLPGMHYRWSFPDGNARARQEFASSGGDPRRVEEFADRMAGSLPMLGVSEATGPAIEAHTRELLDALSAHFAEHRYLLGDRMSLADCGLMGPFYGHLYRDLVPGGLLRQTARPVCVWIERMARPNPERQTGFLPDDALPDTLLPVLRSMADGVPFLLQMIDAIEAFADQNARPGEAPPRGVGLHPAEYRGVAFQAGTRPYTLWMLQRPLDAFCALDAPSRTRVLGALAGTGWEPLLELRPRHRIGKRGNELIWEEPGSA